MRSAGQPGRSAAAPDNAAPTGRRRRFLAALGWSHRDAVGGMVAALATVAVLTNVLFLQPGPHPAPLVQSGVVSATGSAAPGAGAAPGIVLAGVTAAAGMPRPRPSEIAPPSASVVKAETPKAEPTRTETPKSERARPEPAAHPSAEIVTDIQRELSRRGFYDGVVDGRYGPRTDTAIRDFEAAAGLRPGAEANEALLHIIVRSPVRARPAAASNTPQRPIPPANVTRPDPIAEMLTPSRRVTSVQRALTEFGYGQISPSGIVDGETQAAIEKFERERKLPVTGQISHRVVRELAAITGRPLE